MLHLAFGFPVSRLNLSQQQRTEAVLLSNFRMFNLNHSRCQLARSEESHSQNPEQQAFKIESTVIYNNKKYTIIYYNTVSYTIIYQPETLNPKLFVS